MEALPADAPALQAGEGGSIPHPSLFYREVAILREWLDNAGPPNALLGYSIRGLPVFIAVSELCQ